MQLVVNKGVKVIRPQGIEIFSPCGFFFRPLFTINEKVERGEVSNGKR